VVTSLQLVERLEDAGVSSRGGSESVTVKRVSSGTNHQLQASADCVG
jgi:hypothetical protein